MGKHSGSASRTPLVAAGAALLVVLGVAGWAVATAASDDSSPKDRVSSTTSSTSPVTPGSSSSSTSASGSTTTDPATAAAQAALTSCRARVAADEAVVKAAAASANDWSTHTSAQLKLDRGSYTLAQTTSDWARSKVRGAADVAAFTRADKAAKALRASCADVARATAGTEYAAPAAACAKRQAALAPVAATGGTVNAQWAAHIVMMAHKEHADGAAYHDRWMGMVKAAQPALAAYVAAATTLSRTPACPA